LKRERKGVGSSSPLKFSVDRIKFFNRLLGMRGWRLEKDEAPHACGG